MSATVLDLFCGFGGSTEGMEQAGFDVVHASNHWDLAIEVHGLNHPDTEHSCADISRTDPRYYPTTDVLWASPECFTAGHLVTTARGQVPIEEVVVGDLALTHLGRWRPVVRIQHRTAPTVVVTGQGHTGIETTANHRFWLRSSSRVWRNEIRQYRRQYADPGWAPIGSSVKREALWATPVRTAPIRPSMPPLVFGLDLTAAWWMVGRWVGDGSLTFGRNHEVVITCGFHEADALRERLGDTGAGWVRSDKRTAAAFSIGNEKARNWLLDHFGHGATRKGLPGWSLSLPRSQRRALLDGYLSADGGTTQRRVRCSTVSRRLAVSVRLLAESLGHRVAMARDKRTTYSIEGRSGIAQPQWVLHWEPSLIPHRSPEAFEDDGKAWSRVRAVRVGQESAAVYNIEVEEDHSYVLDGIVVANCTNHSVAKGVKRVTGQSSLFDEDGPDPAAERSRATMWDVPRFVEAMHMRGKPYKAVVVENVVDAVRWMYWDAWLAAMHAAGYEHKVVYLNSAFAHGKDYGWLGAPQFRDRIYVAFWRKGATAPDLDIRPPGWCPSCETQVEAIQGWKRPFEAPWGRYRAQYVYRCPNCRGEVEPFALPAAAAINWSDLGGLIGDRGRPLAKATRERIRAGLARYGRPLVAPAGGTWNDEARPVDVPLRARATRETEGVVCPPMVVPVEGRDGLRARHAGEPLRTQTTRLVDSMVLPEPFVAVLRQNVRATSANVPLTTVSANGNHHGFVVPPGFVMRNNNSSGGGDDGRMCTPFGEPVRAITTKGHQSVVTVPDAFLSAYYGNGNCSHVASPVPTLPTRDRFALVARATGDVPDAEVDGCTFRMLEPAEIGAAMAFPGSYRTVGTKRDRVKGFGNAVVPPCARLVGARILAALAADR